MAFGFTHGGVINQPNADEGPQLRDPRDGSKA
jgi:hypothetical protein